MTGEGRRQGREEWGWWGGEGRAREGRGARHGLRLLETSSSGSAPELQEPHGRSGGFLEQWVLYSQTA